MSQPIIIGYALERASVVLMARILGAGGIPITQASLSTLTYEAGYVAKPSDQLAPGESGTPVTPTRTSSAAVPITIADTIYDTLQTGPTWQVTCAASATASAIATFFYVDPLKAPLPSGTVLTFVGGVVTLNASAETGERRLTGTITGTVAYGDTATTGVPFHPAESPWKIDSTGYNFRFELPASELPEITIDTDRTKRWNLVSIEATPTVGEVFGWEYLLPTYQRMHGKWSAAA